MISIWTITTTTIIISSKRPMVMCRNSVYNTIIAIAQHPRFVCAHVKCKLMRQLRVCVKRSQSIYVISIKSCTENCLWWKKKRKEKSMSYGSKMKCYSLPFRFDHIRTAVSYGTDSRSTQSPFLLSFNSFHRESPCRSFVNICPADTHRSIGIVLCCRCCINGKNSFWFWKLKCGRFVVLYVTKEKCNCEIEGLFLFFKTYKLCPLSRILWLIEW